LKEQASRGGANEGGENDAIEHWAMAKEGLDLLLDLGAAVDHEKSTHNLTTTTGTLLGVNAAALNPSVLTREQAADGSLAAAAPAGPSGRRPQRAAAVEDDAAAPPPPSWQLSLQVRRDSCTQTDWRRWSRRSFSPCACGAVQDELAVRQVVQMVVWWGIVPCLDEGVGIPLAQRLQNASACTCITHARARHQQCARSSLSLTLSRDEQPCG
jgi:hypothetical protein